MLCLMLNILQAAVPGILLFYYINLTGPPLPLLTRNLAGLTYFLVMVILFQERFTLMMHFASHRPIFHNETLNSILVWGFAPIFGIPSGVYNAHHNIMHHIENNHEFDASSTERYQRDSWLDFGRYWLRFAFFVWVELPHYLLKTKRYERAQRLGLGLTLWYAGIYFLATYVNFLATFWCFMVPHLFAMSAMAFGNWSQHIFVNPQDSQSNFGLTYNCIDSKTNQTTFNDGYHVVHHLNARLHWSEIPDYFYQTREKHLAGGALTFQGVHFMDVGILVMTKQLRKLAECYVHLGSKDTAPTVEAVEEQLRGWLVPVPPFRGNQKAA